MSFLRLESLSKSFGPVQALDGVDIAVEKGTRTAIVGPSGSGKSTLLRLVAGFEAPDAGRIVLGGECLADSGRIVPAHRRSIGMVSQDGALFPHLSVADNIGFGLDHRSPGRDARIHELMGLVDLSTSMSGRRPHELSGGQQQRVALARALARSPKLMLLDEPFSALDTGLRDATRRMVADVLQAAGVASLLVTHDQGEALSFADQVAILRDGRLVQAGPPRSLYFAPNDVATATFLGDALILPATIGDGWADMALGRLPLAGAARQGAGIVMIRPEQVRVEAAGSEPDPSTHRARIVDVEFSGPLSAVRLILMKEDIGEPAVEVRLNLASSSRPAIGDVVLLRVEGSCRVVDAGPASEGDALHR